MIKMEEMMIKMKENGLIRYKARAECFMDVINAFKIIQDYNEDQDGDKIIRIILPEIKGDITGDTDFEFWTDTPILKIQKLWDTWGQDLHRIIQTIKPFEEYTGKKDNTMWDKIHKTVI